MIPSYGIQVSELKQSTSQSVYIQVSSPHECSLVSCDSFNPIEIHKRIGSVGDPTA